jgi:methionyl-tRNA synthetase
MSRSIYITTPIYYVNDHPHLGHAYATIHADALARYHRLMGDEVFLLTGADEHGEKIAKAAHAVGEEIPAFVDRHAAAFQAAWRQLGIAPDQFVRTSATAHKSVVQGVLQRLFDVGDIYLAEYEGLYSVGQERFVTEKELVNGKLPEDKGPPELRREANYFFRMEKHRAWMREHIESHADLIQPAHFRSEILNLLAEPIGDLSISRPKARLSWGIEIPWDAEHVTYVWFDALLSYVSALGYPDGENYARFWPSAQHLIGKDILRTHTLFWLAMCRAIGLQPYQRLLVSGHLLGSDGRKMSKSLGNGVDPLDAARRFGADVLRYVLIKEVAFGTDGVISDAIIAQRRDTELANDLGNLAARTLQMVLRYRDGVVPAFIDGEALEQDIALCGQGLQQTVFAFVEQGMLAKAVEACMGFVRELNRYANARAPWALAKDPAQAALLDATLYTLLEGLRLASSLLFPVLPVKMAALRKQLAAEPSPTSGDAVWGLLRPGAIVSAGEILFPKGEN